MNYRLMVNIVVFGLLILAMIGCRNSEIEKSTIEANTTKSANTENANSSADHSDPRTIKFESDGKVEIVGTFYMASQSNSPAVLLLHQFGSNRKSYDPFAKRLHLKGFGVLAIDGRGFGDSVKTTDGKMVSVSRTDEAVKGMIADVGYAFDYLSKQNNVDPKRIGIVGASYGSSLAIMYGAENQKVKAVALLSPGLNYFGNMPTEPAVKKYGDRSLLIVAAEDDKASANTVRKLKESAANDKYKVQIYPKGGHGTGIFNAKVGLEDLLEKFLTKSL